MNLMMSMRIKMWLPNNNNQISYLSNIQKYEIHITGKAEIDAFE